MAVLDIPENSECTGIGGDGVSSRLDMCWIVCRTCQGVERHHTYVLGHRLQFGTDGVLGVIAVDIHVLGAIAIGEIRHIAMVDGTYQEDQTERRRQQIIFRVDLFHIT